MKCSICKQEGHNKNTCKTESLPGPDGLTTEEFNARLGESVYMKKCSLCGRFNHEKNACHLIVKSGTTLTITSRSDMRFAQGERTHYWLK